MLSISSHLCFTRIDRKIPGLMHDIALGYKRSLDLGDERLVNRHILSRFAFDVIVLANVALLFGFKVSEMFLLLRRALQAIFTAIVVRACAVQRPKKFFKNGITVLRLPDIR